MFFEWDKAGQHLIFLAKVLGHWAIQQKHNPQPKHPQEDHTEYHQLTTRALYTNELQHSQYNHLLDQLKAEKIKFY